MQGDLGMRVATHTVLGFLANPPVTQSGAFRGAGDDADVLRRQSSLYPGSSRRRYWIEHVIHGKSPSATPADCTPCRHLGRPSVR